MNSNVSRNASDVTRVSTRQHIPERCTHHRRKELPDVTEVLVGRDSHCHTCIPLKSVSSVHFRLVRGARHSPLLQRCTGCEYRVRIVDSSTNGTFVNAERLRKGVAKELYSGDVVSLLHPWYPSPPSSSSSHQPPPTPLAWVFKHPQLPPPTTLSSPQPPGHPLLPLPSPAEREEAKGGGGEEGGGEEGGGEEGGMGGKLRRVAETRMEELYEMHECLGEGSFAEVYRGVRRRDGKQCAIKILSKRQAKINGIEVDLFLKEASIHASIVHPNVVQVLEVVDTESAVLIVMELVKGGELFEYLSEHGAMPESVAKSLLFYLLQVIKHLHHHGIMHRDIKPENILLENPSLDPSLIKLADFGVARHIASTHPLTTYCGTPPYIAPEVLVMKGGKEGEPQPPYTKAADMWSVGVTMFAVLSASLPFSSQELDSGEKAQIKYDGEAWGKVSSEAKDLVARLLQHDPSKRATVEDALLHGWFRSEGGGEGGDVEVGVKRRRGESGDCGE